MLKRNKFPPMPQKQELHQANIQAPMQINSHQRHQILSPNPPISRLQRKRQDSAAKSSSLNSKLLRKNAEKKFGRDEEVEKNEYLINNDYYPGLKEAAKERKNQRVGLHITKASQQMIPTFESAPNLQTQELWEKRDQEEMSTELSKQSDYAQSLKEVKFGGVIEESSQVNMKKREKVRSPSILKNGSRNILNGSLLSAQKQRQRSCSVASGKDRNERQKVANENNTNKIIKQKYKSILSKLQAESQTGTCGRGNRFSRATYNSSQKQKISSPYKYKDEIFPPVYSSLFEGKKGRLKVGQEIAWMRVSDIFKEKQLTLVKTFKSSIEITKTSNSYAEDYFIGALNSVLGCPRLLEKIFEDQTVNPYGIYILKIYQENVWKYIIIDDYIPVIKTKEGGIEPAFTNVVATNESTIDIWPFLLEKAYANYYSRYEALQHGNIIEFAEEIAGSPSKKIQLKSESNRKREKISEQETQKALNRLKKELKAGETIAIGELLGQKGYISLVYSIYNEILYYNDPCDSFKRKIVTFQTLTEICKSVHLITPFKYNVCSSTVIRKGRPTAGKQRVDGFFQLEHPSIRVFKVEEAAEFNVTLRQREKRLYHLKEDFGEYIWCRFILLQKEYGHNGFRWINGEYNQKKSISFTQFLEIGQYWLLIEPQWRINSPNEIILQLSGQRQYSFERVIYKEQDRVLQSGCLDLAQRSGELNQINKFICSYNYVTEKVGLIIENIVNERVNGDVTVMRSIRGLKCKVQILPINREFYEEATVRGDKLMKLKEQIELDIPKGESFTVVLKLRGGSDKKFFKSFDFGC